MPQDSRLQKILNEVEDYEETVIAIVTFSHEVCWDRINKLTMPNSLFMIGRRMGRIDANKNKEHALTPDIVIQLNNNYGIVAEVKKNFPSEKSHWGDTFEQISSYDANLIGWATIDESIKNYDLSLLTHITRKVDITDYYKEQRAKGKYRFRKNFAIVSFNRGTEGKEYMYLEKHYGKFSNSDLNERLRKVVPIPLEKVLPLYQIKFYDAPPPIPYLLNILWAYIFPQFLSQESDISELKKHPIIKLNVTELTERLQNQFSQMRNDARQQEIPRQDWIKEAMEALVRLKLARKHADGPNSYEVDFKPIRNPLHSFAKRIRKSKHKRNISDDERQMDFLKN
jgi:hypothetical protein